MNKMNRFECSQIIRPITKEELVNLGWGAKMKQYQNGNRNSFTRRGTSEGGRNQFIEIYARHKTIHHPDLSAKI